MIRPISFPEFQKICFTVGRAVEVKPNPSALIPAYLIRLNLGQCLSGEHKALYKKDVYTSSAQLCTNHRVEDIRDQLLLTVINFPRKQVGKNMSDCLVTGVQKETQNKDEKRESTVFVRPSSPIELGSRVTLLATEEFLLTNPRDLNWPEFLLADLRIGTLEGFQELIPVSENINKVFFNINLGELGVRTCIAMLNNEVNPESFISKQVMVLTNLDEASKIEYFSATGDEVILCTFAGKVVLEPGISVDNGFKLA